jgi:hypothetical protein
MSFLKKLKKGANKLGDAVAKPFNEAEKAVVKAGDFVAKNTGLDKSPVTIKPLVQAVKEAPKNIVHGVGDVIASPFEGRGIKGIQKILSGVASPVTGAVSSAVQSAEQTGNKVNETLAKLSGEDTDRKPKTKVQGPNPLEQERVGKQPLKNYGYEPGYATPEDGLIPLINRGAAAAPTSEEEQQRKAILVASAKPTPPTTAKKKEQETALDRIKARAAKAEEFISKKVIQPVVETAKQGVDTMDAKVFRFKYGDLVTPQIMDEYRKAEAAKDKATMDKLTKQMEDLKKKRTK